MSEKHSPPYPTKTVENPQFTAWVERRAIDLCTDAVPEEHTDARPCFTHLQAAHREGLDAWGLLP
jgi:hypothetical protein